MSLLVAPQGFSDSLWRGNLTFVQKSPKLNSRTVYCSQLYSNWFWMINKVYKLSIAFWVRTGCNMNWSDNQILARLKFLGWVTRLPSRLLWLSESKLGVLLFIIVPFGNGGRGIIKPLDNSVFGLLNCGGTSG